MAAATAWAMVSMAFYVAATWQPQGNAATLYVCAMSEAWRLNSQADLDLESLRDGERQRFLERTEHIAWLIREARRYPHCSWPIRDDGPFTLLVEHQEARRIVRMMGLRVRCLTAEKRSQEAFEEWISTLRLIECVQKPYYLVTQLISGAMLVGWCELGAECAPYWPAQGRREAIAALQRFPLPDWRRGLLEGELGICHWMLAEMRQGAQDRGRLRNMTLFLGATPADLYLLGWMPERMARSAVARYRDLLEEYVRLLDLPVTEFRQKYNKWRERTEQARREPIRGILVRIMLPSTNYVCSLKGYDFSKRVQLYRELLLLGLQTLNEGPHIVRQAKSSTTEQPIRYRPTRYGFLLETDLPPAELVPALLGEQVVLLRFGAEQLAPSETDQE